MISVKSLIISGTKFLFLIGKSLLNSVPLTVLIKLLLNFIPVSVFITPKAFLNFVPQLVRRSVLTLTFPTLYGRVWTQLQLSVLWVKRVQFSTSTQKILRLMSLTQALTVFLIQRVMRMKLTVHGYSVPLVSVMANPTGVTLSVTFVWLVMITPFLSNTRTPL